MLFSLNWKKNSQQKNIKKLKQQFETVKKSGTRTQDELLDIADDVVSHLKKWEKSKESPDVIDSQISMMEEKLSRELSEFETALVHDRIEQILG